MWKKKHLRLTKDQKERGVIFSSVLYANNGSRPVLHEVMDEDPAKYEHIRNLKDVSFFKNMARDFGFDVIEEIRE